jgi:hypothetical protein
VQRTFRNVGYPIVGSGAILILISAGIFSAVEPHHLSLLRRILTVVIAIAVAVIPYRAYVRAKLVTREDGLTIFNPIRTVHARWEEVEEFDIQRAILRVHLTNGIVVHVWAVQPAGVRDMVTRGMRAQMILADLKSLLKEARAKEA